MIDAGEFRRGNVLRLDGKLFELLEVRHQKIGRGSAQVRLRMRDLKTGAITERVNQAASATSACGSTSSLSSISMKTQPDFTS